MSEKSLNPDIKEIQVGIRELRNVYIYPLSISDQLKLTKQVKSVIEDISTNWDFNNMTNEQALDFLNEVITENLSKILEFVTEEQERPSFEELTNNQFVQIVNIVFEVNYEGLIKNFQNLFKKFKGLKK